MELHTDANDHMISGVVIQCIDGFEKAIAYWSKPLNESQNKWTIYEREAYAVLRSDNPRDGERCLATLAHVLRILRTHQMNQNDGQTEYNNDQLKTQLKQCCNIMPEVQKLIDIDQVNVKKPQQLTQLYDHLIQYRALDDNDDPITDEESDNHNRQKRTWFSNLIE